MAFAWLLVATSLLASDAEKPDPLVYLREVNDAYLKESEISIQVTPDGKKYRSRVELGKAGSVTLTLQYDPKNHLNSAEVLQESSKGKKSAVLQVVESRQGQGGVKLQVKRNGLTDFLQATAEPIVATEGDWSGVLQLVRHFDAKKAAKTQEFPGIWLHPSEEPRASTVSIERVGNDTITRNERSIPLDRFRVKLRGGEYLVWADASGMVCKIVPLDRKGPPVVLKGYEEATKELAK